MAENVFQITIQPKNYVGEEGETAVFTVEATGESLSYQWEYQNVDSEKWNNSAMTGYDTPTLNVPITSARDGQKYRCVVTDGTGTSITSDIVMIKVGTIVLIYDITLQAIANAIRAKNGSTNNYTPAQMANAINEIVTDGAGEISLSSIEVYVADYSVTEDVLITVGAVDVWKRTLVS